MKKLYFQLLSVLFLLSAAIPAQAQESKVMQVHSGGSVVYEIPTAQVDSVTFGYPSPFEDLTGIWESNPEPGVTIILTIEFDQVYVSIPRFQTSCTYMIHDGLQYQIIGDKMYSKKSNYPNFDWHSGFHINLFPDHNTMKLGYFGPVPAAMCVKVFFLFNRKTDL